MRSGTMPPRPPSDRLRDVTVPAMALLPIRFFFGVTFLYAGLDKLLDPGFFDAASAGSIQAQMLAFERDSPLAALVAFARPEAAVIGLLIAVAEVAIGIGALTGIAFRVAAAGGALLSLLFFLTVSWGTHPFYLGPDLPYAVGWLTLAIAGHGGLLVPHWVAIRTAAQQGSPRSQQRRADAPASPERRILLQTGLLAVAAVAVSSLALPLRMLGVESGAPSPGPSASEPPPTGIGVAAAADVDSSGAVAFTVPFDAPAPLPAGDPAVIVRLADGSYAAFDAICTHAGCTVEWDAADAALACPCHGAVFDPEHGGAAVVGPAREPLASIPIVVDPASGQILLRI